MKKVTLTLTAVTLTVMALTSCGGAKPATEITGDEEIVSIRNELQELCNKEYIESNYCGIGQGKSSTESMAAQVSSVQARENLAASVQTEINARAKTFGTNDPSGQALEGAAMRAIANVGQEIVDISTPKIRTTFNKEEKQYTVYTLVISSREAVLEQAKQKLRSSEELAQIQRTLNLNANVDRILEQTPTQVE